MELPKNEDILASAVTFLVEGQENEAAATLLACSLEAYLSGGNWYVGNVPISSAHINLVGPRRAYEIFNDDENPNTKAVLRAISAVLPEDTEIAHFTIRATLTVNDDWKSHIYEFFMDKHISNQAVRDPVTTWNSLNFRSQSEVQIANALDKAGVLFLPNCMARLSTPDGRRNREADFLICSDGKWGILEVDGEPFHPPTRAAEDHKRDRFFRAHGITVVEHFDATDCYNTPDDVVKRFLEILKPKL